MAQTALTAGDDGEIVLRKVADGAVLHVFSVGRARRRQQARDLARTASAPSAATIRAPSSSGTSRRTRCCMCSPAMTGRSSPSPSRPMARGAQRQHRRHAEAVGYRHRQADSAAGTAMSAAPMARCSRRRASSRHRQRRLHDQALGSRHRPGSAPLRRPFRHGLRAGAFGGRQAPALRLARRHGAAVGPGHRPRDRRSLRGHNGPVYAVAFAADGTVLTGGIDRTIRIWRADGGEQLAMFPGAAE